MTASYRPANNSDVPSVQKVVYQVLREYGLTPEPGETDKCLQDIEKFYFSRGGYFEVCEVNGVIVGSWGIQTLENGSCELRKMYLLSSQRGKGIGREMMVRSLAKAKELGFKRVELDTASVLKEAIAMYQKFGFKPFNGKHIAARCDQAFELWL
jgi:putative acetyltransferase